MQMFVLSKHSITQKIENSPVLQGVFAKYARVLEDCPVSRSRIRNLKSKKHRFESYQRPLGRGLLFLGAVLNTMLWVIVNKAGSDEANIFSDTLAVITERDFILLGMCADIADEAIALLRLIDTEGETNDLSQFQLELETFVNKLHSLINAVTTLCIRHAVEFPC